MYASIDRYCISAAPIDDVAEVGWRLGTLLGRIPGVVASVVMEDTTGTLFTVRLFEDRASLTAAAPIVEHWKTEHCGMLKSRATEIAAGEVLAQKGL